MDGCIFKLYGTSWLREGWYRKWYSCEWNCNAMGFYICRLCGQIIDDPKNAEPWYEPCKHKW